METVRALLNWRSLRWKIALLVAVAGCAIALTVGLLVHRSTYERSMATDAAQAYSALQTALASGRGSTASQLIAEPGEMPPDLVRMARANGTAAFYDDSHPMRPQMWAAQARPDGRVARTARRIAAGDLDARTRVRGRAGDEITEISATVDSMADSLRDRLLSEQRFTADVAHELRTPLMGLVTSTELLPESEATDLVRDRVQVLRTLVEDLLEISRLDAGAEQADLRPVPLADVVRDSLARTSLEARLAVNGAPVVAETDPRRLDRILANLVINAHRHGKPPVEVTVDATTVVVRDHGAGFPDRLLAEGPQRFRTSAAERGRGHGLGLTVAAGQARVIGASLAFANAADGGGVATLRLPATH